MRFHLCPTYTEAFCSYFCLPQHKTKQWHHGRISHTANMSHWKLLTVFHTVASCVSLPLYQKQFGCSGKSNRILTVSSLNMYQLGLFEFSKNLINQAREANNGYNKWGSWYTSVNLLIVYCCSRWSKTTQLTHKDWRKEEGGRRKEEGKNTDC